MLKDKKGVELSMNMIIITVLGLLVLMVMIFFIIKNVQNSNDATGCESNNGKCQPKGTPCPEDKPVTSPLSCPKEQRCCMNIGGLGNANEPAT